MDQAQQFSADPVGTEDIGAGDAAAPGELGVVAAPEPVSALIPEELLAVVPAPVDDALPALMAALANQKRVIVRYVGVPIAALVAVLGAVGIHAVCGVLLLLAMGWQWGTDPRSVLTKIYSTSYNAGSGGNPKLGDGKPMFSGPLVLDYPGEPTRGPELNFRAPPVLTPLLPADTAQDYQAMERLALNQLKPPELPPDVIINGGPLPERRPTVARTTAPQLVLIEPPPQNPVPSNAVASGVTKPPTGNTPGGRGPGIMSGSEDGVGEEPVYEIMRGGKGGSGKGTGVGEDRGPSGANSDSPQLLSRPNLEIPQEVKLQRPKGKVVFEVTVTADGTLEDVRMLESSGLALFDEAVRKVVVAARFRPAYRQGVPVSMKTTLAFSVGAT
jgi:protein TonB